MVTANAYATQSLQSGVCVCGNDFRSKLVRFIDAALLSFVCLSLSCKVNNTDADAKIRVNLQAQVVETKAEAKKKKPVERKKSTSDEPKAKRVRKAKDEKKSSASNNKPKRPLTAFFIFMNDFCKTFKEENPSSNVKDVAKQGGEKWKSLTEEEKKVYLDKAAELKAEYNKSLESSDADEELI
ncbi:high mobility group B protein 7-like [Raphanus sativus]|nr:high mobility group B protein 7-like [Raphanus sativus]